MPLLPNFWVLKWEPGWFLLCPSTALGEMELAGDSRSMWVVQQQRSHPGPLCGLQNSMSAGKPWHQTSLLSSDLLSCELSLSHPQSSSQQLCLTLKMLSQLLFTNDLGWDTPDLWIGPCCHSPCSRPQDVPGSSPAQGRVDVSEQLGNCFSWKIFFRSKYIY